MANYTIFTDSGCDLDGALLAKWGVQYCCLTFRFDGEDVEYSNDGMTAKTFYDKMRSGAVSRTAAVNIGDFTEAFEPELQKGNDILYIGFSSGISTTSNSGIIAANDLQEKYPDRKIIAWDTLAASVGQGLLVWMAVEKKNSGASLEENAAYIRETAASISHWFTVEDLAYLRRGGRLSAASYFAATILDIKPILHVDDAGKLETVKKVRSRKKSIEALVAAYEELALDQSGYFTVAHGDCEAEALEIKQELENRFGATGLLSEVGPVIGSHTGPGILVLCFPGTKR